MPDRRTFLTRLGVAGTLLAAGAPAAAQTPPDAPATPSAAPAPHPSATAGKAPSAAASAAAAAMRRFDPKLSDAEVATIAAAIDDNAGAGAALNPKKHRLKNADEPALVFTADLR